MGVTRNRKGASYFIWGLTWAIVGALAGLIVAFLTVDSSQYNLLRSAAVLMTLGGVGGFLLGVFAGTLFNPSAKFW